MPKAKGRKETEVRKDKKVIRRAKAKVKTKQVKVWQHATLVEGQLEEQYSTGSK